MRLHQPALIGVSGRLVAAGMVVMAGTVASRALGFVREIAVAAHFGTGALVDAYLLAAAVPATLVSAAATGLGAAVVSALAECRQQRGESAAMQMARWVITATLAAAALLTVAAFATLPWLTRAMARGAPRPTVDLAMVLGRPLVFLIIPSLLAPVITAILHTYGRFAAPAWRGPVINLVTIAVLWAASPRLGVWALVAGYLVGNLAQLLVLVPGLGKVGYQHRWEWGWRDPAFCRLIGLAAPSIALHVLVASNVLFERILAADLAPGTVASLNYSSRLMQLPLGLLGTSLVTVAYPQLANVLQRDGPEAFARQLRLGVRLLAFLLLPITLIILLFPRELVSVALERGAFGARETAQTAFPLQILALALVPAACAQLQRRALFALQDGAAPLWAALAGTAAFCLTGYVMLPALGPGALALGHAVSAAATVAVQAGVLHARIPDTGRIALTRALVRLVTAACIGGLGAWFLIHRLWRLVDAQGIMVPLLIAITTVGGVFILSSWLGGSEEVRLLFRLFVLRRR